MRALIVLTGLLGACGGLTLAQARTALDKARETQAIACSQVDQDAWYERCRTATAVLVRAERAVKALESLDAGADAR